MEITITNILFIFLHATCIALLLAFSTVLSQLCNCAQFVTNKSYHVSFMFNSFYFFFDAYIRVNHLYNQLVIDIKMCRRVFDPVICIVYVTLPFPFGLLCQLIIDSHWLPRLLAAVALAILGSANYIVYYMVSSICPINKIIVKLLITIQFDERHKTRQMKLKIDSLVERLSKEFVGFYCLYAIKFNRMSFYQYILGISTTYFLVSGFVNARRG